ncbi:hypothetical protein Pmani_024102 [Petrolisthes manimaculis]|uniref:Spindle pole body-associated protein Vik1/Cik1 microtubule binding domain-containing protein n=1 Tax=Petrolisthes manimaculis TaxID=1843537 RepID=A0AAE1P8X1_9EUCA|nr:hypothetical protein Pmani_024102 [Petrolisthes manimaculis]
MENDMLRRKLHNQVQELKGNIRVFCRVRPLINNEISANEDSHVIPHINFINKKTLELCKSSSSNGSSMSGLKTRGGNATEFSYD